MKLKLFCFGIALLILNACASVKMAKENTMAKPKAGYGVVYFYRESAFQGWALSYNIWENEQNPKKLGSLGSGHYFYKYFPPGKYTFFTNGEVRDVAVVDVKANHTYYVQNRIDMGFWTGRPKLTEVSTNEGEGQFKSGELKMTMDNTPAKVN